MKVIGNLMKRQRLKHGLSQRQAANGICAQATVSLIENQNSCPNLEILVKMCHRFNVSLNDVIVTSSHRLGLVNVEKDIFNGRYQHARVILLKIPRSRLESSLQKSCYFCYWGTVCVERTDYFNALYFFNRVFSLNSYPANEFYRIWAGLGISQVYLKQRDSEKALEFANLVKDRFKLRNFTHFGGKFKQTIELRLKLGRLFYQLGEFRQSNLVSVRTISFLVRVHSMYKMAKVYDQISQNYSRLKISSHANLAQVRSKLFTKIYKDPQSLRI